MLSSEPNSKLLQHVGRQKYLSLWSTGHEVKTKKYFLQDYHVLIWHRQEIVNILQSRKLKVRDCLWLPWGPRNSAHPSTPVPVPNSCSEHPSTKAVRGLESCFLTQRETNLKEYKQSYQLTAEGLAVLLLLPPFPNLSNFPLRARCPFCVRYHSTQYLHWGPSGSRPRILWVPSPL